ELPGAGAARLPEDQVRRGDGRARQESDGDRAHRARRPGQPQGGDLTRPSEARGSAEYMIDAHAGGGMSWQSAAATGPRRFAITSRGAPVYDRRNDHRG